MDCEVSVLADHPAKMPNSERFQIVGGPGWTETDTLRATLTVAEERVFYLHQGKGGSCMECSRVAGTPVSSPCRTIAWLQGDEDHGY
jgi:hypothetical protein